MRIFISLLFLILPTTLIAEIHDWPSVHKWPEIVDQPQYVVLYFTQGESCAPCLREETEVFPELRKHGWLIGSAKERQHIRVIDIREHPECAEAYKVDSTPTFVMVELKKGAVTERARRVGFTDDVQLGTWYNDIVNGKAPKGKAPHVPYPTRWRNWTGPDGRHQLSSREEAIRHLLSDGEHVGKFTRSQLDKLSLSELRALHSDDHERRVKWSVLRN